MHGDGDKVFSKDFSKTPSGATYAWGDDDLGNHLMTKWCTEQVCVLFPKRIGLSCDRYSNLTCATTLPLYGKGHY